MSKEEDIQEPVVRNGWRNYLAVMEGLSLLSLLSVFTPLMVVILSLGHINMIRGAIYPPSAYLLGTFVLLLFAVDAWGLVGALSKRPHIHLPVWISFGLIVVAAVFGLIVGFWSWQSYIFYPIIVLLSWTKVMAMHRMYFITTLQLPTRGSRKRKNN